MINSNKSPERKLRSGDFYLLTEKCKYYYGL